MLRTRAIASLGAAAGLIVLWGGAASVVQAQAAAPAPPPAAAVIQAPVPMAGTGPASDVLARLGRVLGLTVLTDSTIQQRVPVPAEPATPENAARQIAAVLKSLPATTRWVAMYVPKPQGHMAWNADSLVAYEYAQEKAFGVPPPLPAGSAAILGQAIPLDKATPIASDLHLYPVCIVTDPGHDPMAGDWAQMPPSQQDLYLRHVASDLLSLPESERKPAIERLKFYDHLKDTLEDHFGQKFNF